MENLFIKQYCCIVIQVSWCSGSVWLRSKYFDEVQWMNHSRIKHGKYANKLLYPSNVQYLIYPLKFVSTKNNINTNLKCWRGITCKLAVVQKSSVITIISCIFNDCWPINYQMVSKLFSCGIIWVTLWLTNAKL